jgi:hypothetical protein
MSTNYTTTYTPSANPLISDAPIANIRPRHYSTVRYSNGLVEKIDNWPAFLTDNPRFIADFVGSKGYYEVQRVASCWHAILTHEDRLFSAVLGTVVTPPTLCEINNRLSTQIRQAAADGLVTLKRRKTLKNEPRTIYHYSADPYVRPLPIRDCEVLPLEILESVAYRLNTDSMAEIAKHVRVENAAERRQ